MMTDDQLRAACAAAAVRYADHRTVAECDARMFAEVASGLLDRIAALEAENRSLASHYQASMKSTATKRAALEAQLSAVRDALAPALASEPRATPGPWVADHRRVTDSDDVTLLRPPLPQSVEDQVNMALVAALRNALPAIAAALKATE